VLVGGNGLVTWAEQWVDSGQAALVVATSALWLAGLGSLGPHGVPIGRAPALGLALGLLGVGLLVGAGLRIQAGPPFAYGALIVAPLLWAAGTIYARRRTVACAPVMNTALQLSLAGIALSAIGLARGETVPAQIDGRAVAAILYCAILGSCVAYSAFLWLLHRVSPALLGTYAYVNPAVAVVLGSALLSERMRPSQWIGTLVILAAVVLVTRGSRTAARVAAIPEAQRETGQERS
jgi:drug/metabolite transporter (DMT)-like permease